MVLWTVEAKHEKGNKCIILQGNSRKAFLSPIKNSKCPIDHHRCFALLLLSTTVSPWIVRKSIQNIFQNRTMQVLIVNSNYANLDMHSAVWKKNRINTSFTVCKSALYKDLYCTITTIPPKSHNETQTIYGAKMCKKCRRHPRSSH